MHAFDMDGYLAAWRFAAERHGGQLLPGSELPYIVHVGAVAMEVLAGLTAEGEGLEADLALCCALLHDTVEDTATTPEEIAARFGPEVAEGVAALTKDAALPDKSARMRDSLVRIKAQPREVRMVKLADRITNLQPPPANWTREKCARYREEAGLILAELGEASAALGARLRAKIAEYGRYC